LYDKVLPVRYESVSVLFTDFKSFTTISEQMTPEQLIGELDECFRIFDAIVGIFGLEKIKTIGDSYMCAGGLPTPNDTHPVDVVKAAIEMQHGLQLLMERKKAEGQPALFEMRIGIHTGPVVAGVVGSHKFAYDIWGDTVNTAARMEQGSQPHKINISAATYELVKHRFECTYRGKMAAKNKGEIDMYFVEYPDLPTTPSP
jgi:class 3 adenylate cyclase